MLDGKVAGQQLGAVRDGALEHRPCWDVTLSAPKSVSIMVEVAGDRRLIAAHGEAVKTALAHVEKHMAATRIRGGGTLTREATDNLAIASFQHDTSRAQDPQLHTHNVILNTTRSEDGTWRSLEPRAIYQLQKQIGAIYRQELALNVRELGYEIDTAKDSMFEIKNVSAEAMAAFSSLSAAIEAGLGTRGATREDASAAEKQIVALDTRQAKVAIDHAILAKDWRETADKAGFDSKSRLALVNVAETKAASSEYKADIAMRGDMAAERAIAHAREKLGERQSVFSASDLQPRSYVDRRGAEFAGFTTRKNIENEAKLLRNEADGRGILPPIVSRMDAAKSAASAAADAKQAGFDWNADQRTSTTQLLTSHNRITALQGFAGTAKTTTVLATLAREGDCACAHRICGDGVR